MKKLTALEVRLRKQMEAVVYAEVLFGAGSIQHKRQVAKMVTLQNQHAKVVAA